ncbi:hypothetical protein [Candidatus Poriferisodalis sp.]|uniref:hypothetical protein n=1 Tax=Candidatus Poriferisodalis sp. TaxID=3101277 RepID=UPI003B01AA42
MPVDPMPSTHTSVTSSNVGAAAPLRLVEGATGQLSASDLDDWPNERLRALQVRPWDDPVLRRLGHDPRSVYVERFWVAVLGPSAVWLLRLLAREFDELGPDDDLHLDLEFTARRLGLQHRGGRQSTFMRTVDRCRMFDLAYFDDDAVLLVRRRMPPVPRQLYVRMPRELRNEVGLWTRTDGHADFSVGEIRLLATCMLMLGNGLHEAAERLVILGLPPSAANEATAWAWAKHCVGPHSLRQAQR